MYVDVIVCSDAEAPRTGFQNDIALRGVGNCCRKLGLEYVISSFQCEEVSVCFAVSLMVRVFIA